MNNDFSFNKGYFLFIHHMDVGYFLMHVNMLNLMQIYDLLILNSQGLQRVSQIFHICKVCTVQFHLDSHLLLWARLVDPN